MEPFDSNSPNAIKCWSRGDIGQSCRLEFPCWAMEKVLPVHLVSPLRSIDAYANMKITEEACKNVLRIWPLADRQANEDLKRACAVFMLLR